MKQPPRISRQQPAPPATLPATSGMNPNTGIKIQEAGRVYNTQKHALCTPIVPALGDGDPRSALCCATASPKAFLLCHEAEGKVKSLIFQMAAGVCCI